MTYEGRHTWLVESVKCIICWYALVRNISGIGILSSAAAKRRPNRCRSIPLPIIAWTITFFLAGQILPANHRSILVPLSLFCSSLLLWWNETSAFQFYNHANGHVWNSKYDTMKPFMEGFWKMIMQCLPRCEPLSSKTVQLYKSYSRIGSRFIFSGTVAPGEVGCCIVKKRSLNRKYV